MQNLKKYMLSTLVLISLASATPALAAANQESVIHVTGYAEQEIIPDMCMLTLGLENTADTAEEAQVANAAIMNELIDDLKAMGINSSHIQSTSYTTYPIYDTNDRTNITGYRVNHNLKVRVVKLDMLSKIINTARECGVNKVSSIQFSCSNVNVLKKELLTKAILNGKNVADNAAAACGAKLGKVKEMHIGGGYNDYVIQSSSMSLARSKNDAAAPQLEPGAKKITESVDMTFYLE